MSPTVLLVEDDPNDTLFLTHAFGKCASEILLRCVSDGEMAIEYLAGVGSFANRILNPTPQVVLLDLRLPKKSGFDVLGWMKSHRQTRRISVIIHTSSAEPGDIEKAYALGANSYVVKPPDLQTTRDMVRGIGAFAGLVGA